MTRRGRGGRRGSTVAIVSCARTTRVVGYDRTMRVVRGRAQKTMATVDGLKQDLSIKFEAAKDGSEASI